MQLFKKRITSSFCNNDCIFFALKEKSKQITFYFGHFPSFSGFLITKKAETYICKYMKIYLFRISIHGKLCRNARLYTILTDLAS